MTSRITNNAWGVLNTDITANATSLDLVPGHAARFPSLVGGDYAWGTLSNAANQLEIVKITAISGDTFQIQRAQDGTNARIYNAGDRLDLRITAGLLNGKLDADDAAITYAPKDSPTLHNASLTGQTTAVTPPGDANDVRVATTAFVVSSALSASLPGQTGNAGKFITTDGTAASWGQVYPPMAGNAGKFLSTNGNAAVWVDNSNAETQQNLTDGTTIAWNLASGSVATVTLAGDRTMNAPTNMAVKTYILLVKQDATGNRKIAWNSVFKWAGKAPPTLSTEPNAVDVFSFFCDGVSMYGGYLRGVG